MADERIAIDIGMTNVDVVLEDTSGKRFLMFSNPGGEASVQLRFVLDAIASDLNPGMTIGVTGGRYRDLPKALDGYQIHKVNEMLALGLGGLALSRLDTGLVVSAGTGVAMVAARDGEVKHVTGSAVGGGTLLGLARLILGTNDILEIDRLALAGDASAVDIMLTEAVGGEIGRLPASANAVNLGKLENEDGFTRENLAAGLVRLVAQVIAVIAINAANAENLADIIMVGHLMDLESIRKEVDLVGQFYQRSFTVPENPGFGTAIGVLEALKQV
jgi:type II pantothenate kinase